jgi:class 3 adenylate cyclase
MLASRAMERNEERTSIDVVADAVRGEELDLGSQTSPDGAVTLLFSDVEGSTDLMERLGERQWLAVMRDHNALIRNLTFAHEGNVVKSQGDGFMLAFASAHAALRCAIDVERVFAEHPPDSPEAIRIRMGAHSGFVIAEADDFYGRNVVLAARIADQADGGEILVSETTKQYTEADPTLRFELRGEFRLKGLVGEHAVYALLWE